MNPSAALTGSRICCRVIGHSIPRLFPKALPNKALPKEPRQSSELCPPTGLYKKPRVLSNAARAPRPRQPVHCHLPSASAPPRLYCAQSQRPRPRVCVPSSCCPGHRGQDYYQTITAAYSHCDMDHFPEIKTRELKTDNLMPGCFSADLIVSRCDTGAKLSVRVTTGVWGVGCGVWGVGGGGGVWVVGCGCGWWGVGVGDGVWVAATMKRSLLANYGVSGPATCTCVSARPPRIDSASAAARHPAVVCLS